MRNIPKLWQIRSKLSTSLPVIESGDLDLARDRADALQSDLEFPYWTVLYRFAVLCSTVQPCGVVYSATCADASPWILHWIVSKAGQ